MKSNSVGSLLVAYLPILRAYCRRIAGSHQRAEDLLQEVSVRILAGDGPTDPRDFLAWCFGIARHALSYEWRMQRRARAALPLEGELMEELSSTQFDPDNQADARAWLARASRQIDGEEFDLLVRRYVLEETGKELADGLGQSSAALRMRLMRLRATLNERSSRGTDPPAPSRTPRPVTLRRAVRAPDVVSHDQVPSAARRSTPAAGSPLPDHVLP